MIKRILSASAVLMMLIVTIPITSKAITYDPSNWDYLNSYSHSITYTVPQSGLYNFISVGGVGYYSTMSGSVGITQQKLNKGDQVQIYVDRDISKATVNGSVISSGSRGGSGGVGDSTLSGTNGSLPSGNATFDRYKSGTGNGYSYWVPETRTCNKCNYSYDSHTETSWRETDWDENGKEYRYTEWRLWSPSGECCGGGENGWREWYLANRTTVSGGYTSTQRPSRNQYNIYGIPDPSDGNTYTGTVIIEKCKDIDPPEISSASVGSSTWAQQQSVTVNASDNIGVSEYAISKTQTVPTTGWQSSKVVTSQDDGTNYVFARDSAGNTSQPYSVQLKVDRDTPAISSVTVPTLIGTSTVVSVNSTDAKSGVSQYRLGNSSWQNSKEFRVQDNGSYTVYSQDKAGNVSNGYTFNVSNINKSGPLNASVPVFGHIGDTMNISFSAAKDAVEYMIESKTNGGAWTNIGRYKTIPAVVQVTDKREVQFRIATVYQGNQITGFTETGKCQWRDPPVPPKSVTAYPKYAKDGEPITIAWLTSKAGGKYIVQKTIDDGKSWTQLGETTGNTMTDIAKSFWLSAKYRVCHQVDPNTLESSKYAESNKMFIAQELYPPKKVTCSSYTINTATPIEVTWEDVDILGDYWFNVYQQIGDGKYELINQKSKELLYTEDMAQTWNKVRYKVTVTDGVQESTGTESDWVTNPIFSDPNDTEFVGGVGGYVTPMDPESDGIAISTTKYIATLRQTVFGNLGFTTNGKFKTYEQVKETGFEGYTEGMSIPVVYRSNKTGLNVSGYLMFNGQQYQVHWGDFTGPTSQQNLSGTVNGYVFVPKAEMTEDNPAIECLLYVQDSETPGESGTPRMHYSEAFTVGVDMGNP